MSHSQKTVAAEVGAVVARWGNLTSLYVGRFSLCNLHRFHRQLTSFSQLHMNMKALNLDYSIIPRLPEEVILEILSRLPAKYVVRFRCVCRRWLSLTSDSQFIKLHTSRSVENNHLNLILICYAPRMCSLRMVAPTSVYCLHNISFDEDLTIDQVFLDLFRFGLLAGSCNGLVCLVRGNNVLLLNPTTKECKIVEIENELEKGVVHQGSIYHRHPLNSKPYNGDVVYGLGYDSARDEYQLVQFISFEHQSQNDSKINMYSLNDSSCVTISPVPYSFVNNECGIYLNGALHWLAKSEKASKPQHENVIVSFDITKKVIQEFQLPDVKDKNSHATLGVLRGQFCFFRNSYFEIWVMKTYGVGGSWYKLASVDASVFGAEVLQRNGMATVLPGARLLCFSKGGGILLSCAGKLFLYDPEKKTSKHVKINGTRGALAIKAIITSVVSYTSLNSGKHLQFTRHLQTLPIQSK